MAGNNKKVLLNVGCGPRDVHSAVTNFTASGWVELRYDIDPETKPDIVGSITNMSAIESCSVDIVYSSHNLEHLQLHEVQQALVEFLRVLRPTGYAMISVPDLQSIAGFVAKGKLFDVLYHSPAGAIRPVDIIYGYTPALAAGNNFMAHQTGFTAESLGYSLFSAGFAHVLVRRHHNAFSLSALAFPQHPTSMPEHAW